MGPLKSSDKKTCQPELTANDYKEQGNRYFTLRKYNEAQNCYTKALVSDPSVPVYYTNRALCHLKLKQWHPALQDCRQALELDSSLVKAHFFAGQALLELKMYDEAIMSLMHAHELAKEQRQNFGDDITAVLRLARKRKFVAAEEKRIVEENELHRYLRRLMESDLQRQREAVTASTCDAAAAASGCDELDNVEQEHIQ